MVSHILFCLDEIDCEIEAREVSGLEETEACALGTHIAAMRTLLAGVQARQTASRLAEGDGHSQHDTDGPGDRLALIRGLDDCAAARLRALGKGTFAAIAGLTASDIACLDQAGLPASRIAEENWIEQAAILATGRLTHYAASLAPASKLQPLDRAATPALASKTGASLEAATPVGATGNGGPSTVCDAIAAAILAPSLPAAAQPAAIAPLRPESDTARATLATAAREPAATSSRRSASTGARIAASLLLAAALTSVQFGTLPTLKSITTVTALAGF